MNAPIDRNTHSRLLAASAVSVAGRPAAVQGQPAAAGGLPDIGAMLRRVFAHWHVMVVTLLIGGIITAQVVHKRKPMFKSETVIFFREGIGKSVTGPSDNPDMLRTLGSKLKETLLAQQNLRKLIDEFQLYRETVQTKGYADAVDQMRKKTEFKSRSQDTFAIAFEGTTREEAQKVCARMAELLVAEHAKRLQEDIKGATEFLEVEKKRADDELDKTEKEVSSFLNLHPEFAGKDGLGTESLAEQKKASEEEKRRHQKALAGTVRQGKGDLAGGPGGLADRAPAVDPVLLAAKTQAAADLSAARRDLSDKSLKYTDQHPDVRAATDRVASAEASLRRAEEAIAASQPAEPPRHLATGEPSRGPKPLLPMHGDRADHEDRKAKPKDADTENKVVVLEMEWARLSRAVTLARARQADLEQKLYKAEMVANTAESGYGTTMAVLDPAFKPSNPSNAPSKTVAAIGLGVSIAVGLVLSAAWGLFLDDRLFAASEIEGVVMVPVLGIVPKKQAEKRKSKRWWGFVRG